MYAISMINFKKKLTVCVFDLVVLDLSMNRFLCHTSVVLINLHAETQAWVAQLPKWAATWSCLRH